MFLETANPAKLTAARQAMIAAARQLLDTLGDIEGFDSIALDAGDSLGVEVTIGPMSPSPVVALTHVSADGVRRVLAHVAVAEPPPSAH